MNAPQSWSAIRSRKAISATGRTYVIAAFLAVMGLFFVGYNGIVGLDVITLLVLAGAIILGRGRAFMRDWVPFLALLFIWQLLRGYADEAARHLGFPLHDADLIAADCWLFRGVLPSAVLQRALYVPGQLHWYDVVATAFWGFHFVLPLVFAFVLWLRNRVLFQRFAYALLTLVFAALVTHVVFPAIPPWMATFSSRSDRADPIVLIRAEVLRHFQYGSPIAVLIVKTSPNEVAAMPSLHAAFPALILAFTLAHWRRIAPFSLAYCCGMWFSSVYIGDHYVVDVLGGIPLLHSHSRRSKGPSG